MVKVDLPAPRPAVSRIVPESCATCRFRVAVTRSVADRDTRQFADVTDHECRAEPPRPKSPFPWVHLDAWCGFWDVVPGAQPTEPAHYAITRDVG